MVHMESRLRVLSMAQSQSIDQLTDSTSKAVESMVKSSDGVANMTAIKEDSQIIEQQCQLLSSLM